MLPTTAAPKPRWPAGTGVCGGLILLARRENSFCVPVNRASSILAGLTASFGLAALVKYHAPGPVDLIGATLVIAAILVLSLPGVLQKRAQAAAPAE